MLQLDKLLITPDGKHLKLNNFQLSRQFSAYLGCGFQEAVRIGVQPRPVDDDGEMEPMHEWTVGPPSPKVSQRVQ